MAASQPQPPLVARPFPRLRGDLIVTPDFDAGYTIEDPCTGRFCRLGRAEYLVAAQLDGRVSLAEAARNVSRNDGLAEFLPPTLETLGRWLLSAQLVEVRPVSGPGQSTPRPAAPAAPVFDPCYVRVSLGCPDALIARLTHWFGWLFSPAALVIVLALSLWAGFAIVSQWTEFSSSLGRVLCPDQHLALLGCWLMLKLAHELGHGIACKRLGGDIREWGVALAFFMPTPYTDVTSSWRFGSRRERMAVAAAGMYVEWIIAVVSVLLWSWTASPTLQQLCVYTASLASFTTIFFNANPLCRLDGYYLLSDLLGWPNLAAQGQQVVRSWQAWLLLGSPPAPIALSQRRYWVVGCYGLAASAWRMLTLATMTVIAVAAYHGLGIVLIVTVAFTWFLRYRRQRSVQPSATGQPTQGLAPGLAIRGVAFAAAAAALWWYVPWPGAVTAPGVVEHTEQHTVRVRSAGHVTEILVENGQWVDEGQTLAVLQNDALRLELGRLENLYQQGEVRQRSLRTKRQQVELQVEEGRQEALRQQIAEQQRKVDALTVGAPAAGRVIARRLADLPGSYLSEGSELCLITAGGFEFRLAVAQGNLPSFSTHVGAPMLVQLPGQELTGVLRTMEPRASSTAHDPTLGANAGGPLPVAAEDPKETSSSAAPGWKLVEPRFIAHVVLGEENSAQLLSGQRGYAYLRPLDETIGKRLARYVKDWIGQLERRASAPPARAANRS